MNQQQKLLLENSAFAILPYTLDNGVKNHQRKLGGTTALIVNESCATVKDLLTQKAMFWKFIDGVTYQEDLENCCIKQNQNQTCGCLIPIFYGVEKIVAVTNNSRKEYIMENSNGKKGFSVCAIDFSFDDPIQKLILYFNFGLAEPLELPINML